ITQQIGRATRLDTKSAWAVEPYQIANYGLGGQYDLHYDAHAYFHSPPQERISQILFENYGDRLGTFMIYLEDVPEGGATVFPDLKLLSEPVLGDAVFWFNLQSNGLKDERTRHGGCPVLIGSKWITNKWINSNVQMFTHPCPLEKDSDQTIRARLAHY
ncbi:Uncharacterized protein FKW44_023574, partial [Caligus rogercresseyi]